MPVNRAEVSEAQRVKKTELRIPDKNGPDDPFRPVYESVQRFSDQRNTVEVPDLPFGSLPSCTDPEIGEIL